METYRDWDNDSGIDAYEIGDDYIVVEFKNGRYKFYKYTYRSAGSNRVFEMKRLAKSGDGLNGFIKENGVKYETKW